MGLLDAAQEAYEKEIVGRREQNSKVLREQLAKRLGLQIVPTHPGLSDDGLEFVDEDNLVFRTHLVRMRRDQPARLYVRWPWEQWCGFEITSLSQLGKLYKFFRKNYQDGYTTKKDGSRGKPLVFQQDDEDDEDEDTAFSTDGDDDTTSDSISQEP